MLTSMIGAFVGAATEDPFTATCAAMVAMGIAGEIAEKKRIKNGHIAFMLTALKVLMTYKYSHTHIELPGQSIESEFIITGFGNGLLYRWRDEAVS